MCEIDFLKKPKSKALFIAWELVAQLGGGVIFKIYKITLVVYDENDTAF